MIVPAIQVNFQQKSVKFSYTRFFKVVNSKISNQYVVKLNKIEKLRNSTEKPSHVPCFYFLMCPRYVKKKNS